MTLRESLVAEACTWLNTPYRHHAQVKGAGCDCIGLLAGIFATIGVHTEIPTYSPQWHLHQRGRALLLQGLRQYCQPAVMPEAGDVAVFWFGHDYSHAALVLGWPACIHASLGVGRVELVNAKVDAHLMRCEHLFWRPNVIAADDRAKLEEDLTGVQL